jgi:type I restriction enzyme R subunit
MSTVGQKERKTQNQVIKLFTKTLKYDYLGDWHERPDNRNVEETLLRSFLKEKQKYTEDQINKVLYEFNKVAGDQSRSLYDINKDVYALLRYGVKVRMDAGENTENFWLIDWKHPEQNHFAIAEEVTILGENTKRPDIVLYVNGIALGVLELKRSTVSVSEGIRQNLDNQKSLFIKRFFTTMQLIMAGNDTQGLRYATIETPEKYYLTWKEPSNIENPLHRGLSQLCEKKRFLEIIHDFTVFDAGDKKLCRHNQYFGVQAAHDFIRRREGGIIWHAQGSGKSLIMIWLAKWIREHVKDSRVLVITDRTELDEQIEGDYNGVNEQIYRTTSGADFIARLNDAKPWLLCSLIHKFVGRDETDFEGYVEELRRSLPQDFIAKGDIYVFVDECHRTQSGVLHEAMKALLLNALFIGFTGTPLLKTDKRISLEVFGRYIHTYKYDEAVADKVVLDLRYEARDIDQEITSQKKIDQWFEAKTKGLNDVARAQLKKRWGTMQTIFSSQSRLERIVDDVLIDMETKDRLRSGRGNAMVVSGSIYQACKLYEMFSKTLGAKCAIVTSYKPSAGAIKGEETGEGETEKLTQYEIYQKMLADYFSLPPEKAVNKVEEFEKEVKKKFVNEPGQMKLLIVVDKLLTGFDAPPATYLYIDKQMQDHGLFQAICRVNRLDGDDKEYGYIIDYKDLFKSLEGSIKDYTSGAFDGYDKEDVAGLLSNRLEKAKEQLELALETVKALCEPVEPPKDTPKNLRYFCAKDTSDKEELKENENKRLTLYKAVASLLRAYANLANEMDGAGYSSAEAEKIKKEVEHFESVRNEVKLASGDYIDLKMYEPAMRHLIDTYIRAEESEKISAFDDMTLVQLIVERGVDALNELPRGIRQNKEATAETIENNIRRVIVDEQPVNPKYYEKMSELLDALIQERRQQKIEYEKYLARIVELTKKVKNPAGGTNYPTSLNTNAKRALYDNLDKNEHLAMAVHEAVVANKEDEFRAHPIKLKKVRYAIRKVLNDEQMTDRILDIVKNQIEY